MTSDPAAEGTLDPGAPAGLLAELTDTLDTMIDQPLAGAHLFGGAGPAIGRYIVERRLGTGATSVVYAAHDTTLDRRVALKIMARHDVDGAWHERALAEARALARLHHPNVVEVHDVGEWIGHPFIAMELVAGTTLARWQTGTPRPSWQAILRHYLAAARGLDAAHSAGLVHRDFKPANVLVAADGRVVVTDFGLAIVAGPAAGGAAALPPVGTPAYLAPEQQAGAPPLPGADVYSFSVALCEALIGRHPLIDPAFEWRPALARTALSRRARMAIERGMEPAPTLRWPRLAPLLADLERVLPDPWRRPAGPPGHHHHRRRAAGALLALGVGVMTGLGRATRDEPTAPRDTSAQVEIARGLRLEDPTGALALLREVPADRRGTDWIDVALPLLMRPIAREVRCFDDAPRTDASVAHGLIAAIDDHGRASVCELAAARTAPLAEGAICARVLDRGHVGVVTAGGELTVFAARRSGWEPSRRIRLDPPPPGAPWSAATCEFDLKLAAPGALALRGPDGWRIAELDAPSAELLVEGAELAGLSRDRGHALVLDARGAALVVPVGWRAARGAPAPARAAPDAPPITRAAVDPDSGVAALIGSDAGAVIDLETGAVRRRDPLVLPSFPGHLAIAPGGHLAAAATGRGLLLWWPLDGPGAPRLESVSETTLVQLAWSPAGTRLLWRNSAGVVGVRDVGRTSEHELPFGGRSMCHATFITDDRVAAVTCDGRVLAWDLAGARALVVGRHELGHCRPDCPPPRSAIWSAAVSPDGTTLATAGREGTVGLWRLDGDGAGSARLPIGPGRRSFQLLFEGDLLLVTNGDDVAQIWNWRTRTLVANLPGHGLRGYAVAAAHPAPGQTVFVTSGRNVSERGGKVQFFRKEGALLATDAVGHVLDLATSPSGRLVAAATTAGAVAIYDAATGTRRVLARRGAEIRRVAFLDEDWLLSAGDDGVVQRIATASGQVAATLHARCGKIYDMDRHGDRLLLGCHDGTIRLWDLRAGTLVRTYVGHLMPIQTVRWKADGSRFVSGDGDVAEPGRPEGRACVWRVDRDTCQDWLIGHRHAIRAAQFLDDERVVTASYDGTVRIWRPAPQREPAELLAELERRAPACLDGTQRVAYLREPPAVAAARAAACRAAAP